MLAHMSSSRVNHVAPPLTTASAARFPSTATGVYLSWGALGFLQGPLTPLTFEHGAEITYPTSPENAASFQSLAINLWGLVDIMALTPLLQRPVSEQCSSVATPAAALALACVGGAVFFVLLVKEDNRRAAAEKEWEAEEPVRRVRIWLTIKRGERLRSPQATWLWYLAAS